MRQIPYTDTDRLIYDHEIRPFLPDRIIDAHTHVLLPELNPDVKEAVPLSADPVLADVDVAYIEQWWKTLFPDSQVHGLILGFPTPGCRPEAIAEYLFENVGPSHRFSLLVKPSMDIKTLENLIVKYRPAGLKPYMTFAPKTDRTSVSITDFIPEEQIALADRHKLCITLHVSRPRGMADRGNIDDIRRLTRNYPNCTFILAHCGRCFITPNAVKMLNHLPVADNLYLDTSAVCDLGVFIELFSRYDTHRILFGTDLVTATAFKGTHVRLGMSWELCPADIIAAHRNADLHPTFSVYESLCTTLYAARFCRLSETSVTNIFFKNAARLFNIS